MNRILKSTFLTLIAIILSFILVSCKKSEPIPESERAPLAETNFQKGIKLEANGKVINIEVGHLVPCVNDWNSDGKKDLVVGQFSSGAIRLYLNQGTDTKPVFNDFSFLHADGKQIKLDAG
jgi:hypothetical protein